ncbi:ribosomal protein P2, partial [Ascoidea rubescens DSM 1968]
VKYLAAYLLLVEGGHEHPASKDIEHLLETVGIEADHKQVELLLKSVSGKTVDELITSGSSKLASLATGGAVASSGSGSDTGSGSGAAAEEEKEEASEEEEESDDDMGFGLFD